MNPLGVVDSLLEIWKGLWRYARGRRRRLTWALLLLAGAEALRLPLPWLAGRAIDELQTRHAAGLHVALQWLGLLLACVVLAWFVHAAGRILERHVALHARRELSLDLTRRLLRQPLSWHRREHPLATAQRAQQGAAALTEFAENQYVYLQGALQLVGPLVALTLISPRVGAVAATGLLLLTVCSLGFDSILLNWAERRNAAERRLGATWGELLAHVPTLLALRLERGALALVRKRVEAILQPLGRLVLVNELKWGTVDLLGQLLWCAVVVVHVAEASAAGAIALGGVFMVYEYARRAEAGIVTLAADFSMLSGQLAGWRALQPLLAAEPPTRPPPAEPVAPWQRLEMRGVSMEFAGAQVPALRDVNLVLERGRRYALLGDSGAGKSTLLALLAGLEDPSSGTLLLDGRSVDANVLRTQSTLIDGSAAAFEGSVRENIAPGGDIDNETLGLRLHHAGLAEQVALRPDGYEGLVGEGLARWSRGEIQRLALARGLHAALETPLWLLDEPTSHLAPDMAHDTLERLLALDPRACIVAAVHDRSLARHFDACIHLSASGAVMEVRLQGAS